MAAPLETETTSPRSSLPKREGRTSAGFRGLYDEILAEEIRIRAAEARTARRMAELHDRAGLLGTESAPDLAKRSAAGELAVRLVRSSRTMTRRMAIASSLVSRFPEVLSSWEAGRIDRARAELVERHGAPIDDRERRVEYEAEALWHAERLAPGRLEPVLRRLSEQARQLSLDERAQSAARLRRVTLEALDDGLAALTVVMREWQAHAVYDRLTAIAVDCLEAERESGDGGAMGDGGPSPGARPEDRVHGVGECGHEACGDVARGDGSCGDRSVDESAGEGACDGDAAKAPHTGEDSWAPVGRTLDEARADAFAELMLQADPAEIVGRADHGAPRLDARIAITVPALALLGRDDRSPASLIGVGPVPLDTARQLASARPSLQRILTDPVTEVPIAVESYRPPAALRRALELRDETCRFPGCGMRAARCDLDHTVEAASGGPTSVDNLSHLCRSHHTLKHHATWTKRQEPGGIVRWLSPTGHETIVHPPSTRPPGHPRRGDRPPEHPPGSPVVQRSRPIFRPIIRASSTCSDANADAELSPPPF